MLTIGTLVISGLGPFDGTTWVLEVFPILIGLPLLIMSYSRFPLASLLYRGLFLHALILMLGGHYSYARVPIGFWVQEIFDFSRNHYDRFGYRAQGFIPAILTRENLLRRFPAENGCSLSPPLRALRLALSMNSLNGGPLSLARKARRHFSVRRAMCGIRSGICFWLCLEP